ncbi:MAG: hypothetical protein ACI8SJ_001154 [Shewanella sp.]|jgi:hypothetical protein
MTPEALINIVDICHETLAAIVSRLFIEGSL